MAFLLTNSSVNAFESGLVPLADKFISQCIRHASCEFEKVTSSSLSLTPPSLIYAWTPPFTSVFKAALPQVSLALYLLKHTISTQIYKAQRKINVLVLRTVQWKTQSSEKLDLVEFKRTLRRPSKLEPVPEKSDNIYGVRIPNPWILSTDKASKLQ
ncbi:hypothetical protein PIB30_005299 [Stylosanthes scabra]|uniref:Uncharacterized protein n=1 Tax=Stylosanthes scabra TaxID=79078 RepID=A0ABU6U2S6_9FABA|nr:hypothetical protein [Stylosanthes scabra]